MADEKNGVPCGIEAGTFERELGRNTRRSSPLLLTGRNIMVKETNCGVTHVGVSLLIIKRIKAIARAISNSFANHDIM
jgi:hypothetical protein